MTTESGQQRHYVHGDLDEAKPDAYFCARCDAVVPPSHFADQFHTKTLAAKLVQSMAGWLRKAADPASNGRRPEDARNLFPAELAAATLVARHDEAKWAKVTVDRY